MLRIATVAVIAWPLLLHAAAIAGQRQWMQAVTAVAALAAVSLVALRSRDGRVRAAALAIGAVLAIVLVRAPALAIFIPAPAINLVLALLFARTLQPGCEPMIARFARRERGALEPDLARYARSLTVLWVALFATMAGLDVLLALAAPLVVWSLFCNVISYGLVALLFVGEHAYRRRRFAHYRHAPLAALVRNVVQSYRAAPERSQ